MFTLKGTLKLVKRKAPCARSECFCVEDCKSWWCGTFPVYRTKQSTPKLCARSVAAAKPARLKYYSLALFGMKNRQSNVQPRHR